MNQVVSLTREDKLLAYIVAQQRVIKRLRRVAAEWNEDDHPRDEKGQFSSTGDSGSSTGDKAKLGSIEAKAEFNSLKKKWANVNNDLLAYVDNPNAPEAQEKVRELKTIVKDMYDLPVERPDAPSVGEPGGPRDMVIVGAGPAGLSAAIMGGTDGLDTLVIDSQPMAGGQSKFSSRIENYPGFPAGTSGENLATNMYEQAQRVGAQARLGTTVTGIDYDDKTGIKTLTLSNGEKVQARTVVVAGGVAFQQMEFPGSTSSKVIYGDGKTLGAMTKGGDAVVIGGSNGAAQAALGVARGANSVTVLSRSPITKGMSDYQVQALRSHPKIKVIEGDEIKSYDGSNVFTKSGGKIKADGVGVFIGGAPQTSWLPSSITRDARGRVNTGTNLETSMPGVFAVGDIRSGSIGRIGAAVGDGQMASHFVWDYFDKVSKQSAKK